jgi:hypothetical protein
MPPTRFIGLRGLPLGPALVMVVVVEETAVAEGCCLAPPVCGCDEEVGVGPVAAEGAGPGAFFA